MFSNISQELIFKDNEKVFYNSEAFTCLRRVIYDMLVKAKSHLQEGLHLYLFEAYRPIETQILYWENTLVGLRQEHPDMNLKELEILADKLCANPYTHGSGHQCGSAVDVSLVDSHGKFLDMGSQWRELKITLTKTYTQEPSVSELQLKNRGLLLDAMLRAGFTNYIEEWWHFSYGDRDWVIGNNLSEKEIIFTKIDRPTEATNKSFQQSLEA